MIDREQLCQALSGYLDEDLAAAMQEAARSGPADADALTARLQAISGDRHIVVRHDPALAARIAETGDAVAAERKAWVAALEHRGIGRVVPGAVGLLELTALAPVDDAGEAVNAAFAVLSESRALILDLRTNPGGYSDMVQLVAGWLLPHQRLYARFDRDHPGGEPAWTLPPPGPRFTGPLAVLIGPQTFSAAEALAACLKETGRALLVGQTSGGGANTGGLLAIGGGWLIRVPTGRVRLAATGRGWEGGVVPTHPAPLSEAEGTARRALERQP